AFFNCWTRKEAYIKARGEGLSLPLDQFDVAFAPDARPALLDNRNDRSEISRWLFNELRPASGYKAAIAIERGFSRLLLWNFDSRPERDS
ncbi:MAG TPA: 4'-phosphopantetheinyl transferase superfamily protein, partial [Pyrinomonadaceae bacterium]|nr:4'-phosphopantetheinyl transferase superfamily protein [Pyrinomonadaceae bacterium]